MGCCGGKASNHEKGIFKVSAAGQTAQVAQIAQIDQIVQEPVKPRDVKIQSNPSTQPRAKVLDSCVLESSEQPQSKQTIEMSQPKASQSSSPTQYMSPAAPNNAESMSKQESKSSKESPLAPKQHPVFSLQQLYLSGQWYISGVNSEQIHPEINKRVEIGFHTGVPVYRFLFQGLECFMNYAEAMLTIKHPDGDKVHSIIRKIADYANIVWLGDDEIERPFPEAVETYIESIPGSDVHFQLDERLLVASLSKGELRDENTSQTWRLYKKTEENSA